MTDDLRRKIVLYGSECVRSYLLRRYHPPIEKEWLFNISKLIETEKREYAVQELEKLLLLVGELDDESEDTHKIVYVGDIYEAIARLNGEHDQPNN